MPDDDASTDESPGYSLIPVDHQPDFSPPFALVPVDHNPFADEGGVQVAQAGPANTESQQPPVPQPQPIPASPQSLPVQPVQFQPPQTPQVQAPPLQPEPGNPAQLTAAGASTADRPANPGGVVPPATVGNDAKNLTLTQDVRRKILERANEQLGSTAWDANVERGNFGKRDKCNLFVYEMLNRAGANPGLPHGYPWWNLYPPTAGDWANPAFEIPGWRMLGPNEVPEPGDVVAQPGNFAHASGHVMIVGPNDTFLGVTAPEIGEPSEKIGSIPKSDDITRGHAKGPPQYRRFVGH